MLNKSKLFHKSMIANYEISGEGNMSRIDSEAVWETFDITLCEGTDDRFRLLKSEHVIFIVHVADTYSRRYGNRSMYIALYFEKRKMRQNLRMNLFQKTLEG